MSSSPPLRPFPPTTPDLAPNNSRRSSRKSVSNLGARSDIHEYRRIRRGSDATAYVDSYLNNFMVSRINNEAIHMPADAENPANYRIWQPYLRDSRSVCGGDGDIEVKVII